MNHLNKCMNHLNKCRKKDCKWCLVFKNAPQHMGANCLISNEILVKDIDVQKIKARYGSFDKLRVDGSPVSLGTETIRKWIMPNLNNKIFESSMDIIDLDKLYYGSQKSLDGSVVQSFNITDEVLEEVLFNPCLENVSNESMNISISVIAIKIRKGLERYSCDYRILQKTYIEVGTTSKVTGQLCWKGPLPSKFDLCFSNEEIYLLFLIDSDIVSVKVISEECQDITLIVSK